MLTELTFPGVIKRGQSGKNVRRVQEWLTLNGIAIVIDSQFGPATEQAVRRFQSDRSMTPTGIVDEATFNLCIKPLKNAVANIPADGRQLGQLVVSYARQHLTEHPREVGGQNSGPWVRLYMDGNEGVNWPWCAGFVSFILKQAADTLGVVPPVVKTYSCDILGSDARHKQVFVEGSSFTPQTITLQPGSIFLVKRASNDWEHTGIVTAFNADTFETIEGNTNDDGSREGYEVCLRTRGLSGKDFIRIQ